MGRSAAETLRGYVAAQSSSVDAALRFISDDATFDVGRGRYQGSEAIRGFLERLQAINSRTSVLDAHDVSSSEASAVFEQRDDDLAPLGVDHIRLNVHVEIADDGRIKTFTARPTPESIEVLTAARKAGRNSEGARLAERAGTLPPDTPA